MNIFEHVCSQDGVSISYFFQAPDECSEHGDVLESCCSESAKDKDDDCCSDIVSYISVKLDYFETFDSIDFEPTQIAEVNCFNWNYNSIGFEEICVAHSYDDPPPLSPKEIRIHQQIFTI